MHTYLSITLSLLAFGMLECPQCWAADLFSHRVTNALGNADRYGYVSYWQEIPAPVEIAGKSFSLALRFCTAPESKVGKLFGDGWYCPFLESCVVERAETNVSVWTPGGQKIDLARVHESEGKFESRDSKWKGLLRGDHFELQSSSGETAVFVKGYIESAKMPEGYVYSWVRKADEISVFEKGRQQALLTVKQNKNGLADSIISGNKEAVKFDYQQLPHVAEQFGMPVVVGLMPAVSKIRTVQRELDILYQISDDRELMSLEVLDGHKKTKEEKLNWSMGDGTLVSDALYNYSLVSQGGGIRRPKIIAVDKNGQQESYEYNYMTGVARHIRFNGDIVERKYILTPGVNYGRVREFKVFPKDSNVPKFAQKVTLNSSGAKLREEGLLYTITRTYTADNKLEAMKVVDKKTGVAKVINFVNH